MQFTTLLATSLLALGASSSPMKVTTQAAIPVTYTWAVSSFTTTNNSYSFTVKGKSSSTPNDPNVPAFSAKCDHPYPSPSFEQCEITSGDGEVSAKVQESESGNETQVGVSYMWNMEGGVRYNYTGYGMMDNGVKNGSANIKPTDVWAVA